MLEAPDEFQKDVENRNWMSRYRGLLLIHASRTFDEAGYKWVRQQFKIPTLPTPGNYHLGGVVGQVNMVDCVAKYDSPWFGGPVGFVFSERRSGPFIACNGMPGIFDVKDAILDDYYPLRKAA